MFLYELFFMLKTEVVIDVVLTFHALTASALAGES